MENYLDLGLGTLRKSEQLREITASRKLTMLFTNFFSQTVVRARTITFIAIAIKEFFVVLVFPFE